MRIVGAARPASRDERRCDGVELLPSSS
jgi:hypothetical protein